jgi:hypothetical protein
MKKTILLLIFLTSFFSKAQTKSDIELLNVFGINPNDINSGADYKITTLTVKFQNLIDEKKARSIIFARWNDMLSYYLPNGNQLKGDITNFNNPPVDELGNYVVLSADKLGVQFMNRQIQIFVPKTAGLTNQFTATKFNEGDCRQDLVSYINGAFYYQQTGNDDPNVNNSAVRTKIRNCFRAGLYDNIILTNKDITVQFNDKDNPFKGFRGFGDELDINEIEKLLMGETSKLSIVGPNGKNVYLPFRIDAKKGMR